MTNPAFSSLGLSDAIVQAIVDAGYETPTPIQKEGIPAFLSGSDIIVQAQTGTGKTAAFVLPFVQNSDPADGLVQALVLTPTRELALQVSREFGRFGAAKGLIAAAIYGGTAFQPQFDALEKAHVVVATPGRLLDLFRRKRFDARNIKYFGLDEADELLSMGFEKDVLDIIAKLPKERQSFICSATMGAAITRVAQNFINDPTTINVSSDEIGAQSVRHEQFPVHQYQKLEALRRLIGTEARDGALVFANTRVATFTVTEALRRENFRVDVLNGELSQAEREKALARMRAEEIDYLVATDVAARGIDISGLPAVINYDMPESPEVYVHRTGRTGRAGQAGVAYSLVTPADISVFHALQKFYKLEFKERTLPSTEALRSMMADQVLDTVLDGLDADRSLKYAQHMPLARRLADRDDGVRSVAKLIAHWLGTRGETVTITEPAPTRSRAAKPAPVAEIAPETLAAEPAPIVETAPAVEAAPEPVTNGVEEPPARAPRRARKQRDPQPALEVTADPAQTADVEEAPEAKPAKKAAPPSGLGGQVYELLENAPRRRGRWRAVRGIARELEVDEELVVEALEADEQFEQSRKRPGQWRLLVPSDDGPREERPPREPRRAKSNDGDSERAPRNEERAPRNQERAPRNEERAPRSRKTEAPREAAPERAPATPKTESVKLTVNVGSDHGLDEEALRNEIVLCAGLDFDDVGLIVIEAESSKVDVATEYWEDVVVAVSGQTLAGQILEFQSPRRRKKR